MSREEDLSERVQKLKKQAGKVATAINQGTWEEVLDEATHLESLAIDLKAACKNAEEADRE